QKRIFQSVRPMSALPLKADVADCHRDFCAAVSEPFGWLVEFWHTKFLSPECYVILRHVAGIVTIRTGNCDCMAIEGARYHGFSPFCRLVCCWRCSVTGVVGCESRTQAAIVTRSKFRLGQVIFLFPALRHLMPNTSHFQI